MKNEKPKKKRKKTVSASRKKPVKRVKKRTRKRATRKKKILVSKRKGSVSKNVSRKRNRGSRKPLKRKSNKKVKPVKHGKKSKVQRQRLRRKTVKKSRLKRTVKRARVKSQRGHDGKKRTKKADRPLSFDVGRIKKRSRKNYIEIDGDEIEGWEGKELDSLIRKNRPVEGEGYKLPMAVVVILHLQYSEEGNETKEDAVSFLSHNDMVINRENILKFIEDCIDKIKNSEHGFNEDKYSFNLSEADIVKIQVKFLY